MKLMGRPPASALVLCIFVCVQVTDGAAFGDVVLTHDGRLFEGKILESNASKVRIDAMVGGVRVQVGLSRHEVKTIEERPLPENFFEKRNEEAAERVSDPASFEPDATLYIEIPIVGRFGVQIVPSGLKKCLSYASRHNIGHVVFQIDSQGGDQIAAREIYDLLAEYDSRLKYHAVIRDSVGVTMAVTVWCENVFLLPGANLGGTVLSMQRSKYDGDPEILLSQVAHEVNSTAEKKGWPPAVMRAMIDPSERVSAWADENGEVVTGVRVPPEIPSEKVVFRDDARAVLTLSRTQAVTVGIGQKYRGTVEQLGQLLEVASWQKESDFGRKTMLEEAAAQQRRLQRIEERNALKIAKLVRRRDETKRYMERYLTLAHKWDPSQKPYSTYRENRSSWDRYWAGEPIQATTTRKKWQAETDTTIAYLRAAHKGVRELHRLEDKAAELDVEPLFKEGELDAIQDDIEMKVEYLLVLRNRRASATG